MSNKRVRLPSDIGYIGNIRNRRKLGKTRVLRRRFGRSQYNQGGFNDGPQWACMSEPGFESDINRFEKLYKREYFKELIKKADDPQKATEWIDPIYDHIDCEHIINTMENLIRAENLKIKRIKPEAIKRIMEDSSFINEVRENRDQWLDNI